MRDDTRVSLDNEKPDMIKTSLAIVAVRRLVRAMDKNAAELARETGLNSSEFLIVQAVGAGGHETIHDLVRVVRLSSAAVKSIVRGLEDRGFLQFSRNDRHPDKAYLTLTESGRGILRRTPQLLQTVFLRNFAALPGWEQAMIVASLDRTVELMSPEPSKASEMLKKVGACVNGAEQPQHH